MDDHMATSAGTSSTRSGLALLGGLSAVAVVLIAGLVSLAIAHPHRMDTDSMAERVNPADPAQLASLLRAVETDRVVMVGETHDRHDHHQNQLAVIQGLHQRGVPIAIGMEYFQRPFQPHLDDFTAGLISESTLLERTEWDRRWRFDVALYRDILAYAQRHRIPLLALNAASETVDAVSSRGLEALDDEVRAGFPQRIELARGAYRDQLISVFAMHGTIPRDRLQRFLEVQYVWDQTMARTAGNYLNANPDRTLVLLAGSGHLLHDDAIPSRLRRIHPGEQSVIVTDMGWMPPGAEPDYVLAARTLERAPLRHVADAPRQ
jgi:uncharacterized iron-regulated protein